MATSPTPGGDPGPLQAVSSTGVNMEVVQVGAHHGSRGTQSLGPQDGVAPEVTQTAPEAGYLVNLEPDEVTLSKIW